MSTASRAIAVAAVDTTPTFPGANIALNTGQTIQAINAQRRAPSRAEHATSSCCARMAQSASATRPPVQDRRQCAPAHVARAIYGQQAGAVAVVMINTSSIPAVRGSDHIEPDTGVPYTVTIQSLGVKTCSDCLVG
jgi:hypothetical protein